MIEYLSDRRLPEDEKEARESMLAHSRYSLIDDVLYYSDKKDNLFIVPPTTSQRHLFDEALNGIFGGYLRDAKIYSQLSRHYCMVAKDAIRYCQVVLQLPDLHKKKNWKSRSSTTHPYPSSWLI